MLDIGWSELLVIGVLALLVVGPKELPRLLRTVGQWAGRARSMARDFQRSMDDVAREADLGDLAETRKIMGDMRAVRDEATQGLANPGGWARDAAAGEKAGPSGSPGAPESDPGTPAAPSGNG